MADVQPDPFVTLIRHWLLRPAGRVTWALSAAGVLGWQGCWDGRGVPSAPSCPGRLRAASVPPACLRSRICESGVPADGEPDLPACARSAGGGAIHEGAGRPEKLPGAVLAGEPGDGGGARET